MPEQNVDRLVARVKKALEQGDLFTTKSDEQRWKAAELLWELNHEHGLTQAEIGQLIGRTRGLVTGYVKVFAHYRTSTSRPTWAEAWATARQAQDQARNRTEREIRRRPGQLAEVAANEPEEVRRNLARELASRPEMADALREELAAAEPERRDPTPPADDAGARETRRVMRDAIDATPPEFAEGAEYLSFTTDLLGTTLRLHDLRRRWDTLPEQYRTSEEVLDEVILEASRMRADLDHMSGGSVTEAAEAILAEVTDGE